MLGGTCRCGRALLVGKAAGTVLSEVAEISWWESASQARATTPTLVLNVLRSGTGTSHLLPAAPLPFHFLSVCAGCRPVRCVFLESQVSFVHFYLDNRAKLRHYPRVHLKARLSAETLGALAGGGGLTRDPLKVLTRALSRSELMGPSNDSLLGPLQPCRVQSFFPGPRLHPSYMC